MVVASMHFGSWEVGSPGADQDGRQDGSARRGAPAEAVVRQSSRGTTRPGVHIIPIDTQAMREGDPQVARRLGAASMREVFKVLRSGGVVAMALDRDLIGNGEPLEFFGKPAPIPIGTVEIAIRAGEAIVPILLYRNGCRVNAVVRPGDPI